MADKLIFKNNKDLSIRVQKIGGLDTADFKNYIEYLRKQALAYSPFGHIRSPVLKVIKENPKRIISSDNLDIIEALMKWGDLWIEEETKGDKHFSPETGIKYLMQRETLYREKHGLEKLLRQNKEALEKGSEFIALKKQEEGEEIKELKTELENSQIKSQETIKNLEKVIEKEKKRKRRVIKGT